MGGNTMSWYWTVLICIGYYALWVVTALICDKVVDGDSGMDALLGMVWPLTLPYILCAFIVETISRHDARRN